MILASRSQQQAIRTKCNSTNAILMAPEAARVLPRLGIEQEDVIAAGHRQELAVRTVAREGRFNTEVKSRGITQHAHQVCGSPFWVPAADKGEQICRDVL